MITVKKLSIAVLSVLTLAGIDLLAGDFPQGPGLGKPVMPDELVKWEIGIMPDGKGLPAGSGTAKKGKLVYAKHCISCHGPAGQGASADQLAGEQLKLTGEWPEKTVGNYWPYATTLFDFNRRSMPMQTPGSLTNNDTYAVTAYILFINGIITENDEMNAKTLAKVSMPNRDGFINVYELEKRNK